MNQAAEILAVERGLWCSLCLKPSVAIHHIVIRKMTTLEMVSRTRCEDCGAYFPCPPVVRP